MFTDVSTTEIKATKAIDRLFAAFKNAGATRPYDEVYGVLYNTRATQKELSVHLSMSQPCVSQMLERLLICGVCERQAGHSTSGKLANFYSALPIDKVDVERVENFAELFELRGKVHALQDTLVLKYGTLPSA